MAFLVMSKSNKLNISLLTFAILFINCITLSAQIKFTEGVINANLNRSGIIDQIKNEDQIVKNTSVYIEDEFLKGKVVFINSSAFKDGVFRYNLTNNSLEIKFDDGQLKVAGAYVIKYFVLLNETNDSVTYINDKFFFESENNDGGSVYRILHNADISLIKKFYTETIKSNYVAAFDVGEKQDRQIKQTAYYFVEGQNLSILKSESDLRELAKRNKLWFDYYKENKIKLKKEESLIAFFEFINFKS